MNYRIILWSPSYLVADEAGSGGAGAQRESGARSAAMFGGPTKTAQDPREAGTLVAASLEANPCTFLGNWAWRNKIPKDLLCVRC